MLKAFTWIGGAFLAAGVACGSALAQVPSDATKDVAQTKATDEQPTKLSQDNTSATNIKLSSGNLGDREYQQAIEKSFDVISRSLSMKNTVSLSTQSTTTSISAMKKCADLADTDTKKASYVSSTNGTHLMLVWVKGEMTKNHVLFGYSCKSQIKLSPEFVIMLSYAMDDADKHLKKQQTAKIFDPRTILENSNEHVVYKSLSSTIRLSQDGQGDAAHVVAEVSQGPKIIYKFSGEK